MFVTLFLLAVLVFTGLMTFYAGPKLMATRNQFDQDKVLFKCQKVIDGSTIHIQMRGWERPNQNPVFPVTFAGLSTPPLGGTEHPAVIQWAQKHNISPALAADLGQSAHKTLLAFIRKQNLFLYRENGDRSNSENLSAGSRVHVLVSGTNVNLKLLESGLAIHDTRYPHAFSDLYEEAQEKAKKDRLGLWRSL